MGEDFFAYRPAHLRASPSYKDLATVTNVVQQTMASDDYLGAIWLEGSPTVEDTLYWLNLLIDTRAPIVANASQRPNRTVSADGPQNIVDSVDYIVSKVWNDGHGERATLAELDPLPNEYPDLEARLADLESRAEREATLARAAQRLCGDDALQDGLLEVAHLLEGGDLAAIAHKVEEAAAFCVPDCEGSQSIESAVILKPLEVATGSDLLREIKAKLPPYALPAKLSIRDELPRTTSDKIDRRQLSQEAIQAGKTTV